MTVSVTVFHNFKKRKSFIHTVFRRLFKSTYQESEAVILKNQRVTAFLVYGRPACRSTRNPPVRSPTDEVAAFLCKLHIHQLILPPARSPKWNARAAQDGATLILDPP